LEIFDVAIWFRLLELGWYGFLIFVVTEILVSVPVLSDYPCRQYFDQVDGVI